jgi:hypothetical protein
VARGGDAVMDMALGDLPLEWAAYSCRLSHCNRSTQEGVLSWPENDVSTLWAKLTKLALQLSSDKEGWAALKPAQIREYRRPGLFRAKGPTHEARELWQEKTDPDSRFGSSKYYLLSGGRLADAVDLLTPNCLPNQSRASSMYCSYSETYWHGSLKTASQSSVPARRFR